MGFVWADSRDMKLLVASRGQVRWAPGAVERSQTFILPANQFPASQENNPQ